MATSKSKDFRNALVALLQGLQRDGEPAFAIVKGHPRGQFDGWPVALVLPSTNTTEKGATAQNERTITRTIKLHVPAGDGSEIDVMDELVDLVLDALDDADYSANIVDSLSAEDLSASSGEWYELETQTGVLVGCDITVSLSYDRDNAL